MAIIRSVYEVGVEDQKFQNFFKLYEKYQASLAKSGGDWNKTNKSVDGVTKSLTAAILAQTEMLGNLIKGERDLEQRSARTANSWRDLARSTKNVASQIKDATSSLLKWASVGGVISGLVGAGGLFGLDSLANGVGNTRRSSLGLGTTYGEKKAFDLNFGRVVDSDAFLGNVNASLHDVTKRGSLYAAGLNENVLKGDTAQVSIALLGQLKRIADATDPRLLGQTLQARRLDQFISLEDFERLRNTPQSELASYAKSFGKDARTFGLDQKSQRIWQDFGVQMSRAGQQIENVFVQGLVHLAGPLTRLSQSIVTSIETFTKSKDIGKLIDEFGKGLEGAAKYIASDQFQADIKTFTTDIGALATSVGNALKWMGVIPGAKTGDKLAGTNMVKGDSFSDSLFRSLQSVKSDINLHGVAATHHNPGNLRSWKGVPSVGGYAQFPDDKAGLHALEDQMQLYYNRDHLNTITGIVSKYAPSGDHNDVGAYIRDVSKQTGYAPSQQLNLNSLPVMAKLISAITKHEDRSNNYLGRMNLKIENNTGGNAIVTTSQLPQ